MEDFTLGCALPQGACGLGAQTGHYQAREAYTPLVDCQDFQASLCVLKKAPFCSDSLHCRSLQRPVLSLVLSLKHAKVSSTPGTVASASLSLGLRLCCSCHLYLLSIPSWGLGPSQAWCSFGQEAPGWTRGFFTRANPSLCSSKTVTRQISERPLSLLGARNPRPRACLHRIPNCTPLRCPLRLLPGGGRAGGTVAGTSLSGLPQGRSPSAFLPCWTATQRVTYPTDPLPVPDPS